MANINQLKQYMSKKGEYDRLAARLKVVNIELDNWDKIKAATITDMPTHHDTEHGDKVGDIVADREKREQERDRIEYEMAKLSEFIIKVDSRLDCLREHHKFILEKIYKDNMRIGRVVSIYNKYFGIAEHDTIKQYKFFAEKAYKEL